MLDLIKEILQMVYVECRNKKNIVLISMLMISFSIILLGVIWPKEYASRSTIITSGKNILTPLLEGSAVTISVNDHIKTAREIIYSRENMNLLLEEDFWNAADLSPIEKARLIKSIISNTSITNVGKQLIQIKYSNEDPELAYLTTKKITELYLTKNQKYKLDESKNAFNFIEQQVQLYHKKLIDADQALEKFRKENIGATPDSLNSVNQRLSTLQSNIEKTRMDIKEATIVRASIKNQLDKELVGIRNNDGEDEFRQKINRLQGLLDEMRLTYHDSYPDVVMIKTQINELIKNHEKDNAVNSGSNNGRETGDFVQNMKTQLAQANTRVAQLATRLEQLELIKIKEQDLIEKINKVESQMIEMRRDYSVNKDIYQKLLRQKETARVSMNIDLANQGMTLRVQEHATLPLVPHGIHFGHFIFAAILFGVTVPIAVVYGIAAVDGQVRSNRELHESTGLPSLGMAGYLTTSQEDQESKRWVIYTVILTLVMVCLYATISWLQLRQ